MAIAVLRHVALGRRRTLSVRCQREIYGVDERNITPYGQVFDRNHLPEIFATLAARSQYRRRWQRSSKRIDPIGSQLRGLAMTGVKFGISFTTKFPQPRQRAGQHLHDGTVQVSTGATEMGQGRQREDSAACGRRVRIDVEPRGGHADEHREEYQHVADGRLGRHRSERRGRGRRRAGRSSGGCADLPPADLPRPKWDSPHRRRTCSFDDGSVYDSRRPELRIAFGELCAEARRERVDLGARGFYATPGVDFNRETGQGTPFFYYTQGAAVAEVLVDRFTGELRVPRVDLLMDIGRSINPGVDRGRSSAASSRAWDGSRPRPGLRREGRFAFALADDVQNSRHHRRAADVQLRTVRQQRQRAKRLPQQSRRRAAADAGDCVWAAAKNALDCVSPGRRRELRLPATGEEMLRCLTLAVERQKARRQNVRVAANANSMAAQLTDRRPP